MRCAEVRQYLFAFLDNELEAPLSMDLQGHLERCPLCAREAEIERAVLSRLEKALEADCRPVPFEREPVTALFARSAGAARTPAGRLWMTVIGLAAALFLAAGIWALLPRDDEPFAELVASESESFLDARGPLHVSSSDRGAVTDWLRDNTQLPVSLPAPAGSSWRLLGGRRCSLEGRLAAFALYEAGGDAASVLVLSGNEEDVIGMEPVLHDGVSFRVSRCGGRNVVAMQRDGLLYSAVSSLPPSQLFDLLGSVTP